MNDSLANIINRLLDTIDNLNRQLDGAKMAVVKKNAEIDELERKLEVAEGENNNCNRTKETVQQDFSKLFGLREI